LVSRLGRSIIALRFLGYREEEGEPTGPVIDPWDVPIGTIDVWWRGRRNGSLMLLLAHLLHQNPAWRRNRIRVLRAVVNDEAVEEVTRHIEELSASARISAEPVIVVSSDPAQAIQQTSAEAAVVILGFEPPEESAEAAFFARMESFVGDLPRVLFIESAGGMELES
ncbi:MAG TPA: amino acid permease, partial [Planctomycetaceae bacterium]|nr:amino acid permease [Planctomycetaceae bacterium]